MLEIGRVKFLCSVRKATSEPRVSGPPSRAMDSRRAVWEADYEDGELLARLPLVAVDLDDPLPGHHLLDETVHLAQVFLAGGKVLLRQFAQPRRHEERQGGQQEEGKGEELAHIQI